MPKPRRKWLLLSLLIVLLGFSLGFAMRTAAKPEYAQLTELPCMACHESRTGGGSLTQLGEAFKESEHQWPLPQEPLSSPFISLSDAVRVILRVLHLSAVAAWLGAIVVIHLVIGPQVVGRGIPRKYIRLGLPAMGILLVSGIFLTLGRLTAWSDIVDTQWGILLTVKVGLFLTMVLAAGFELLWLSPRLRRLGEVVDEGPTDDSILAWADGQSGRPVYVRHDGVVYDLSTSGAWQNGLHKGLHRAGRDLTEAVLKAPHGPDVLTRFRTIKSQIETRRLPRLLRVHVMLARVVLALGFGALLASAFWT